MLEMIDIASGRVMFEATELARQVTAINISGGMLYAQSRRELTCSSLYLEWRADLGAGFVSDATPVAGGRGVMFGTMNGFVHAYRTRTHTVAWSRVIRAEPLTPALVRGGSAVFPTPDGETALDLASGDEV